MHACLLLVHRNYETDSDSVPDLAYKGDGTPEGLVAFSTDPCTAGYDVNFPRGPAHVCCRMLMQQLVAVCHHVAIS